MKVISYYYLNQDKTQSQVFSHVKVFKDNLQGKHIEEAEKTNCYMKDILRYNTKTEYTKIVNKIVKSIKENLKNDEEIEETTNIGIMEHEEGIDLEIYIEQDEELKTLNIRYTDSLQLIEKQLILLELDKKLKKEKIKFENLGQYNI